MISAAALKYARVLLEVAAERSEEEEVNSQLEIVNELLRSHQELRETLETPALPLSAKRNIVEALGRRIPLKPIVVNLMLVLIENARFAEFDQVRQGYQQELDARRGVVRGTVTSAARVDPVDQERLQESLARATGRQVQLDYRVDQSLLGGLTIQMGSTVIDGSVQTHLEEMRRRLAAT